MELGRLYEFLDLAMSLNFTKSAASLHISQPTLSRHIAELEKELGCELFVRSNNSIRLTDNGRALFEKSNAIVSHLGDLSSSFGSEKKPPKAILKVSGSTMQPTVNKLITKLSMHATAQDLPFRLMYSAARSLSNETPTPLPLDLLEKDAVDILVETFPAGGAPNPAYNSVKLCYEPLVLYARPDNPLAQRANLRCEDLRGYRAVALAVQQNCPPAFFSPFAAAGMDPSMLRVVYVDNMLEIPEMLLQLGTDEIATFQDGLTQMMGYDNDDTGTVVPLDVRDPRARVEFWGVVGKSTLASAHRSAILELFEDVVESCRKTALPGQIHEDGSLWSSAVYPRITYRTDMGRSDA